METREKDEGIRADGEGVRNERGSVMEEGS